MNNLKNISPVLPTNNIEAEIEFFEKLGFKNVYDSLQYSEALDYAVMHRDGQSIHLQFQFAKDMPSKNTAQQIKIWVQDLDTLQQEYESNGLTVKRRDNTPWGTNEFGFYSPSKNAIIFVKDVD